jgi:hypothetical protein
VTLAQSDNTEVVEGNHYFPADSIDRSSLQGEPDAHGLPLEGHGELLHRRRRRQRKPRCRLVLPRTQRRGQADQGSRRVLEGRRGPAVATREPLGARPRVSAARVRTRRARARQHVAEPRGRRRARARLRRRSARAFTACAASRTLRLRRCATRRRAATTSRGATLYVTLEPCNHSGADAAVLAGRARRGASRASWSARAIRIRKLRAALERLRAGERSVVVADDPWARAMIEDFAAQSTARGPIVRLKLAAVARRLRRAALPASAIG